MTNELLAEVEILKKQLQQYKSLLDKYGVDSIEQLDTILQCYKWLGNHEYSTLPREDFDSLFNELDKYKSIEQKLGINLETYISLVQNGFVGYVEDDDHDEPYLFEFSPLNVCFNEDEIVVYWENDSNVYCTYQYKDYGKTFALTKEELIK